MAPPLPAWLLQTPSQNHLLLLLQARALAEPRGSAQEEMQLCVKASECHASSAVYLLCDLNYTM